MVVKYEVTLPGRPPGNVDTTARAMAEAFGIPPAKAAALLRRTPGPLTKELDEREAVRVAYKLRRIGLDVHVRALQEADSGRGGTGLSEAALDGAHRGARRNGSAAASGASGQGSQARTRSPFLSQVDESPPPWEPVEASGAEAAPAARAAEADAPENREARTIEGERAPGATEAPEPLRQPSSEDFLFDSDAGVSASPSPRAGDVPLPAPYRAERAGGATGLGAEERLGKPGRSRTLGRVLALLLPGLLALAAAGLVLAFVPEPVEDAQLAALAGTTSGSLDVVLAGRDPTGVGPRADMREALSESRDVLRLYGLDVALVTSLEGDVLAGWTGEDVAPSASSVAASELASLAARAQAASDPVYATFASTAVPVRVAASAVRVRGEPVAVVLMGADARLPLPKTALALGAGALALLLAVAALWLVGRPARRDHDRILADLLRISRGDLGRPVEASDRYSEAAQALERIRISLQEGLERLRRRRK